MRILLAKRATLAVGVCASIWACGGTTGGDERGGGSGGAEANVGTGGKVIHSGGGRGDDDANSGGKATTGGAMSTGGAGQADGGGTMAGGRGSSEGSGGDSAVDKPLEAIWYYLETTESSLFVNLLASAENIPVPGGLNIEQDGAPWASDGAHLALLTDDQLSFYELGKEARLIGQSSVDYVAVHGWIQGVGAVVTGMRDDGPFVAIAKADGSELVLAEGGDPNGSMFGVTVSPGGQALAWSRYENGGFVVSGATFANETLTGPEVLAEGADSPPLSLNWSPDGRWLSFGLSASSADSALSGIFLWSVDALAAVHVSPEGSGFSPYFSFSQDSSRFVMFTSDQESGHLHVRSLSGGAIGPLVPIRSGAGVSPAVWNPFSSLVYQDGESGIVHHIEADGAAGLALPFENFSYSCSLFWVSETKFFDAGCGKTDALLVGTVGETITETPVIPEAEEHYGLSPDRACVIQWNPYSLTVGGTAGDFLSIQGLTADLVPDSLVDATFTPDSRGVVWTDDGSGVYLSPLEKCAPKGAPILIQALDGTFSQGIFVTPPRL